VIATRLAVVEGVRSDSSPVTEAGSSVSPPIGGGISPPISRSAVAMSAAIAGGGADSRALSLAAISWCSRIRSPLPFAGWSRIWIRSACV